MSFEIGDIIASRSLTRERDGESTEIFVLIGKPRQIEDSSDFFAPYQFRGIGLEGIRYAAGVDAVQALQLAMVMIGAELVARSKKPGNKISWGHGRNGDLGFPVP